MKPHMNHIGETLARKSLVAEAKNPQTSYEKYSEKIALAKKAGYTVPEIVKALELEIERITADHRPGDPLFLQGVHNSKVACISSISVLIAELKGSMTQGEKNAT